MNPPVTRPRNRKKSKSKKKNQNVNTYNSFMTPMLEFLSRPANYFANLQSSYASSSGSSQSSGGGGSNSVLSGATGFLANNPLTDGLNGLIGDGSLSRKVRGGLSCNSARCSMSGFRYRADHLVQTCNLVPGLHCGSHGLCSPLPPNSGPCPRLRADLQRDQRQGVLGLRVGVRRY